jgi:hypothetical protein
MFSELSRWLLDPWELNSESYLLEKVGDAWVFRLTIPGMETISVTVPETRTLHLLGKDKNGTVKMDCKYRIPSIYLDTISVAHSEVSYLRGVLTIALRGEKRSPPEIPTIPVKMLD